MFTLRYPVPVHVFLDAISEEDDSAERMHAIFFTKCIARFKNSPYKLPLKIVV